MTRRLWESMGKRVKGALEGGVMKGICGEGERGILVGKGEDEYAMGEKDPWTCIALVICCTCVVQTLAPLLIMLTSGQESFLKIYSTQRTYFSTFLT